MQNIVIIDYGMGNVRSVQKAIEYVSPNDKVVITKDIGLINSADRVVFPGQGAMAACMKALDDYNLIKTIKLCAQQKPFFGICLGLELLFDYSEENNGTNGLSIITGNVIRFPKNSLQVPHIGWNKVKQEKEHPLWHNIADNSRFYSVHSYYIKAQNASVIAASSTYGIDFSCAVADKNIFAVQFHPEKSQQDGLQLLKNFVNWKP